jgi:hypothetical protein
LLLLAGISWIVQLLALEWTVEMPSSSTKFTTSSTQDRQRKVKLMRCDGRHSIKKDICGL